MEKIKGLLYNNPVRATAFISAAVALFAPLFSKNIDTAAIVAFVVSSLGLGEYAQRVENKKTDEALFTEIPE